MSDVLDYDKSIIETFHHIEDILVKFALQNYAAAGAVFLAYYTHKIPLRIAAPVIVVLAGVFIWAICSNIGRYQLLWKIHRIARNHWLTEQPKLLKAFRGDADCEKYLTITTHSFWTFWPVIFINALPAAAAVLVVIQRWFVH
jgi:hypothetical protein